MTVVDAAQASILVVDDEAPIRESLTHWFEEDGFRVTTAADGEEALRVFDHDTFDIVLLDIKMPGLDGMEVLSRIRAVAPEVVVIMITAFASVETAVRALKEGAYDYVTKPFDPDDLNRLIRRAMQQRALVDENLRLKEGIDALSRTDEIVWESATMAHVLDLVSQVSRTDATVLIRGETGTGKELLARAIHAGSPRRFFPAISLNCGAVPDDLLESELFGHERGAFTGAAHRRKGKLELANGGTLFLDEVGNVSPRMQVELLRVLEAKSFTRLGGSREVEVDFRLVAATNADLEAAMREGRFREDLYYRLNVFRIDVPPLRERREDIAPLARHFVSRYARTLGKPVRDLEPEGLAMLEAYSWPGNIRELRNVIERAVVVSHSDTLGPEELRFQFPESVLGGHAPSATPSAPDPSFPGPNASLAEVEAAHVERVLREQGGNITQAARVLEIDRVTLYAKIKKHGIER